MSDDQPGTARPEHHVYITHASMPKEISRNSKPIYSTPCMRLSEKLVMPSKAMEHMRTSPHYTVYRKAAGQ